MIHRYQYPASFYAYQQVGSSSSASVVVPLALDHLRPASVLDVGCGAGAWVAAWRENGVRDCVGVDGDYVPASQLLFDPGDFRPLDVASPFRLGRQFGLVQCLEVAEHLPPAASGTLVDNLVAHSPMVLFSAAAPGQGGENHINERPAEEWRGLFQSRGYAVFDCLRPWLRDSAATVEPWYRYNLLLFVRHDAIGGLPDAVRAKRVPAGTPLPDVSPLPYRARKRLLSMLSPMLVTRLARAKHALLNGVRAVIQEQHR
ncbi:methyltransferase domain-containing protein [Ramlibacter algicola]|uniref:Methyltransferase domain-containing protein n=1 Tax=Ramlibacter algicola TaxID=2795217 RepID=A0A934USL6_9BURK|nr:methyltransferase domain-containing protein [Ramlibacter algicola]MBK0394016.1 methyltransferase domain-containing protein [Ramlibacter algicola]